MNDTNYKVSNTTLKAEWIKDKIFTRLFSCSNCKDSHRFEHTGTLTSYCGRCGAKMTNPQTIVVEYDWG
jgi:Zn-finger protein